MPAAQENLYQALSTLISPLGYELVHLEIQNQKQKVLRLFIDRLADQPEQENASISVEDCANVSRAIDEPLDQMPEIDEVFHGGSYDLEVSSPGVDRPLRSQKDFIKFQGKEARVHVFRPLTAEEIENADYLAKNPKQKHFLGEILGCKDDKVLLALTSETGNKSKKKTSATPLQVAIPASLISKANLEPKFDFSQLGLGPSKSPNKSRSQAHVNDPAVHERNSAQ